jgi:membrane-bound ClpP family serine protease
MEYWVILLLLLGVALIVAEIIFIPGSAFLGIGGFITAVVGIYLAFIRISDTAGYIALSAFVVTTGAILFFGLKSRTWRRFALTSAIGSRVNDERRVLLNVGDKGQAISALRPSGKGEFGEAVVEVTSVKGFLSDGCPIKITRISGGKVFVEATE